jgi:hypothetical protein
MSSYMKKNLKSNQFVEKMQQKLDNAIQNPSSDDGQFFDMITKRTVYKSIKGIEVIMNPAFHFLFLTIPKEVILNAVKTNKYSNLEKEILRAFKQTLSNMVTDSSELIINHYKNDLSKMLDDLKKR